MPNKSFFILTNDKATADNLINQGAELLQETDGRYLFYCLSHINFSSLDNSKYIFTDKINL